MENNMSYLIEKVEALYPRLDKTYRFDNGEKRSVPCGPLETGAKYETSFVMNATTAKALMEKMALAYHEARGDNWPEKIPMPFTKDGDRYIGKCNLKGSFDGKEATRAPKHFDAKNNMLEEGWQLTSGSTINLFVQFVPYHMGEESTGVSLRVRAVQVLTYKPIEIASPFEATDGDFEASSPFGETSGGFDSTEEVTPTIDEKLDMVFEDEVAPEEKPKAKGEAEAADVIEVPKKKVKSKTAAPKDDVDLSALVANWDD
tara:strand:+ start:4053 stop:4829 length:777 start_codon:yes stop_codon:yes gene_type:complete